MTISECVRSSPWWGVVKSLALIGAGPVGLLHAQKVGIEYKKPLKEIGSVWDQALVRGDARSSAYRPHARRKR